MNGLTADLLEVQQHREPHASITAHIRRWGTFSGPPLVWSELWADANDDVLVPGSYPGDDTLDVQAAAVVLDHDTAIVRALRSDTAGGVWVQKVTDFTTTSGWAVAPVQVATLATPYASGTDAAPGIAYFDGRVVVVYADGTNLMQVVSDDDGDSWGAPAVIYASSYAQLGNVQIGGDSGDDNWLLACTGISGAGAVALHTLTTTDAGASWTDGGAAATSVNWKPGAVFYAAGVYDLYVWGDSLNWSTLAKWSVTVVDGMVTWGTLDVIDRAGSTGGIVYDALRGGLVDGVRLLVLEERTGTQGIVATAAVAGDGVGFMEEPVYLSGRGLDFSVAIHERVTPIQVGDTVLLVGASVVYLSAALVPDGDYDPGLALVWPVLKYKYVRAVQGGGQCTLTLAYAQAPDAAPVALEHIVLPGDMIWLERTLSVPASGKSGTVYAALRAVRIDRYRDRVEVLAYDATGMLGQFRARRAKVFRVQDYARVRDVVDIALLWAGIVTDHIATGAGITIPSSLVWRANESALGFFYRLLRVERMAIRANLMTSMNYLSVDVTRSDAAAVDYDYTAAVISVAVCDAGEHCVTDWMLRTDARDVRLVIGETLQDLGDPGSGSLVVHDVVESAGFGGARLTPVYYINRASPHMRQLVYAESARFALQVQAGWIEATANIGLEVLDVVRINGDRVYRVAGIDERWDRGRLRQRVTLAQMESDAGFGYE